MIDEVLINVGDAYRLVPMKDILEENWLNFSSLEYNCGDKCLYAKPDVDLCNGFFVAMFERNFEVPLPKCKRKGGNVEVSVEQSNLDTEENKDRDTTENVGEITKKTSHKKKKRGKKKNKGTSSVTDEQTGETWEHIGEFEKSDEVKNRKTNVSSKLKDGEFINNEKAIPIESEETPQNVKPRKSGKKRKSKNEDESRIEDDITNKEIIETYDLEEMKQYSEVSTMSSKKKKKEDKEVIEVIDDDVQKSKKDKQIEISPVKKKRKMKKENKEIGEIDNNEERK